MEIDIMTEKAYVLFERDYGGTFSSGDVLYAITFDVDFAKKWKSEFKSRSYQVAEVLSEENPKIKSKATF